MEQQYGSVEHYMLDRVAEALERIAEALEKSGVPEVPPGVRVDQ